MSKERGGRPESAKPAGRPPRGASRSNSDAPRAAKPRGKERAPSSQDAPANAGRAPHHAPRSRQVEDAPSWTYGIRAVEMALESGGEGVEELWVMSGEAGQSRRRVREQAQELGLRVRECSADALSRLLGPEANHQGVAARIAAFEYAEEDQILSKEGDQLIVVLDEVQDPHNLGAILRSAVGLGAAAVVIPKNRASGVTATVRRVASGAADRIPVARVTNIAQFLEKAKEAGFWAYGTTVDEGESVANVEFGRRAILVMGSEGAGIRPLVRRNCDVLVRLPIDGVESLNVSVACGIFLYAWRVGSGVGLKG